MTKDTEALRQDDNPWIFRDSDERPHLLRLGQQFGEDWTNGRVVKRVTEIGHRGDGWFNAILIEFEPGGKCPSFSQEDILAAIETSASDVAPVDVMIGNFIAQYDEGAAGCLLDVDDAQALAREFKRMQGLIYCPGVLRCVKCDFRLIKTILTPAGAFANEEPDSCPNCDVPMWRVTWQDEARDAYKTAESQMNRALEAERAHPPLAQSVDQALLARAETAWQRFFYPANDCFDKSPAANKLGFVDLEVADCLRLLLSAVGHEVRPPAGGEVTIAAPVDPAVACLKLEIAAQECLQDSAYKAGLAAGWNFAHSDDEAGFQRARSSTEHVAELRRIRAERTAIRNLKGQTS